MEYSHKDHDIHSKKKLWCATRGRITYNSNNNLSIERSKMKVCYEGKFLKFLDNEGWEWVERNNCRTVAVILPILYGDKTIFVEQYRKPVSCPVIEFPAGLVGDGEDFMENIKEAARRELIEETGYDSGKISFVAKGPASAGLSNELMEIFVAEELTKVGEGGGVDGEDIIVHVIDLNGVDDWLRDQEKSGKLIDLKIWAGLRIIDQTLKA